MVMPAGDIGQGIIGGRPERSIPALSSAPPGIHGVHSAVAVILVADRGSCAPGVGNPVKIVIKKVNSPVLRIGDRGFSACDWIIAVLSSLCCCVLSVINLPQGVVMGDALAGAGIGDAGASFQGVVLVGGGDAGLICGGFQQAVQGFLHRIRVRIGIIRDFSNCVRGPVDIPRRDCLVTVDIFAHGLGNQIACSQPGQSGAGSARDRLCR